MTSDHEDDVALQATEIPAVLDGTLADPGGTRTSDPDIATAAGQLSKLAGFAKAPRVLDRYEITEELGRGAQGLVSRAFDRVLRREVALKVLRSDARGADAGGVARFVAEAQLTAQLGHPNIIAIHDAGTLEDGRPFYTMPLLPRRTLRDVLDAHLAGDAEAIHEYPRVKLLRLFSAACMAVHAAHEHGVVHRDLKPANLILGPTDEMLVADFGLAAVSGGRVQTDRAELRHDATTAGAPIGTPLYMSPEQARGDLRGIGPASDVYALGAILYEILTHSPPIEHASFAMQLVGVLTEVPIHPCERAPARDVPRDLGDLAMRCLAKEPEARPASARALVDEIDACLEGSRDRQRRQEQADRLVGEATRILDTLAPARLEAQRVRAAAIAAWEEVPEHAPLDQKKRRWLVEDEARAREEACERAEQEAIAALEAALRAVPTHEVARTTLADLHLARMRRLEGTRREAEAAEEGRRAERIGGPAVARFIHAPARLRVVTMPPGAPWSIDRYLDRDRQLVPAPVALPATTSSGHVELPAGSYRVVVRGSGGLPTVVPVLLRRDVETELHVDTRLASDLPPGFVLVHGGPAILGGDADAPWSEAMRNLVVPSFAMSVFPITCDEYLAFVRDLASTDLAAALARCPRPSASAPPYWHASSAGVIELPERDEQGDVWEGRFPVLSVSALDAEAYAAWRSARDGRPYRLPTEIEWERAARGADGRIHPWGDHFDPALCKMRLSRSGQPSPEPVGSYPTDISPFGVRDLAGGIADWTSSPYRDDPHVRSIRGGGWSTRAHRCAATFRGYQFERDAGGDIGFRLALDVGAPTDTLPR
ncbi:MAG: SUMF1/EgtB/PvdO family nonheme iron enzyme [Deltaproteobacteria bacterium]|nr:SUMF1/EgtB/PvdO family nonheme iron enzyme [Deltaproteobacteria bacterium]